MSGQCFGCGTEFGVFKKEHGCKNCGFAFCNKCLNDKSVPVPKRNNTKHHVCHKCYKILTGAAPESTQQQSYDLPEAYLKRMAALKEREAGGHSSHSTHPSGGGKVVPEHLRRLDKADREIAIRLEKLKTDSKPIEKVLDTDIHARLAQLKGQNYVPEQKPVYKPPDRRSEVHQVDDLMEQLTAEVDIDSHRPDPVKDVEARLAKFQQADGTKPVVDSINLDGNDKGASDGNDLNKMDKMGAMGRLSSHDGRNIQINKTETSVSGADQVDLQEMQRLMSQAAKEIELDAERAVKGMQQDKELMSRLIKFKKQKTGKHSTDSEAVDSDADNTIQSGNTADSDDENDDIAAKRIIQQYLDEVSVDESVGESSLKSNKRIHLPSSSSAQMDGSKDKTKTKSSTSAELKPSNLESPLKEDLDSNYDDADELPYCCICTEDATIRCLDCDMDLYCRRCFRGCHEEMEITDHRTKPYTAPKGYR